jgi:zinc transport system substrate-binding protein
MKLMKKFAQFLTLIAVVVAGYYLTQTPTKQSTDEIVVSIKPIHSMVCALTNGIATPKLLLDGSFSPHHFQLTPSMVNVLQNAKLVIWIGPAYEMPLYNHFRTIWEKVITLQFDPNIKLKTVRSGALWEHHCHHCDEHDHDHAHVHVHTHTHDDSDSEANDGHLWLNPDYMLLMVDEVVRALEKLYPNHKEQIVSNAESYKKRLVILKEKLNQKLKPYKNFEYIMQHDGTQYFDNAFGTRAVATLTVEASVPVSAAHIIKIRQAISDKIINPRCFFSELQFDDGLIKGYANNMNLPVQSLDYLGKDVLEGDEAYERIMENFTDCLIKGFNS